LYTGYTVNLELRLQKHRAGKGARYTRSRLPVRLFAWWITGDLREARSTEARFKRLTRAQKFAALKAGRVFGYRIRSAPSARFR
jgi:putative endonuclease